MKAILFQKEEACVVNSNIMTTGFYLFLIIFCLQSFVASKLIAGGWKTRDSNDEKIQKIASFAFAKYSEKSNNPNMLRLIRVTSAKSQLVSGTKYSITAVIGVTSCKKEVSTDNALPCDFKNSEIIQEYTCVFTVLEKLWLQCTDLLQSQCS